MRLTPIYTVCLSALLCLTLTACGFHLRETNKLPDKFQQVSLVGIDFDQALGKALRVAFIDARSELVVAGRKATTQLQISNLEEGQRVASFASDLSVRQYLLYLLFDYKIVVDGKVVATQRVRLDKTMNYDADYILGKQEEERQIRKSLREDAARLILLRMRSL
ncbi:MAG: hypothetical protein CSB47_05825 [Proteobacteria bacterium]|nr:MAG: hypothetical protein CSB47_05825 [Pseudomonadota bacterium]